MFLYDVEWLICNSENLDWKSKPIMFFFFKVALKAIVVKSNSCREAKRDLFSYVAPKAPVAGSYS